MENHSIVGGIGSLTAEVLAEHAVSKPLIRLGVPGVYAHGASKEYLLREYGLDAFALIEAIEKLVHKKLANESKLDIGNYQLKTAEDRSNLMERPEDL